MEAEAVVAKMRDEWGVARNAAVYNALLGALVRGNNVDKALRVFDSMQSDERPAVMPTEISFMILIRACVDDGLTGKAKELSAIRDALAESGALENDFSKYESRDVEARAASRSTWTSARRSGRRRGRTRWSGKSSRRPIVPTSSWRPGRFPPPRPDRPC